MMDNVYKFVSWDVPALETLIETKSYKAMDKLNKGGKLTREEKNSFCFGNGCFSKINGWCFDFKPFFKRYIVNFKYYGLHEIWHFDKTAIRANNGGVLEIFEIK